MTAREVDFGWWKEADGRQARLTWSEQGKHLSLFHAAGHSESLGAGIPEAEVRAFLLELEDERILTGERSVESLRTAAAARWAF